VNRLQQIANEHGREKYALTFPVARQLLQKLSGFRGYPANASGEDHFAEQLRACVQSVEHAEAVIATFGGNFPTLDEIRACAHSLRPQFEPRIDQRAEWEKVYGKPEPFSYIPPSEQEQREIKSKFAAELSKTDLVHINREIARHLGLAFRELQKLSWHAYFSAWRDLGFPLTREMRHFV
jgi:hypothetical protein